MSNGDGQECRQEEEKSKEMQNFSEMEISISFTNLKVLRTACILDQSRALV